MTRLRSLASWFAVLAMTGALAVLSGPPALAGVTGDKPFLVVMCKFADMTNEPFTTAQVSDFFSETGKGKGGMYDYFHDVSYGNIDLTGTTVKGWYTLPYTYSDEFRWEHGATVNAGSNVVTLTAGTFRSSDVGKSIFVKSVPYIVPDNVFQSQITAVDSPTQATMATAPTTQDLSGNSLSGVIINLQKGREGYDRDCANTAISQDASIDPTRYYGIITVVNEPLDNGAAAMGQIPETIGGHSGSWAMAMFDANGLSVTGVAHEMGHMLGLQHSWSDQPAVDPKTGQVTGPYTVYGDPYDVMSAMTVHYFNDGMALGGAGVAAGPGLSAPYVDQMGWMPSSRQYLYTPGSTVDLPLLALSHAIGVRYYEVVIPMADQVGYPGHYLAVEYRFPDGWDRGIGAPAVLIHEVLPDGRSVLLTKISGGPWGAYSVYHDPVDNVAVGIGGFDSTYYPQAWIEVSPDYPGGVTPTRPLPGPPPAPAGCEFYGSNTVLCDSQQPGVAELELGFGGPGSWAFPGNAAEVSTQSNGAWSNANYDGRPELSFDGSPGTYSVGVCSINSYGHTCTAPTVVTLAPPPTGGGASGGGTSGGGSAGGGCMQAGCPPHGHAHE